MYSVVPSILIGTILLKNLTGREKSYTRRRPVLWSIYKSIIIYVVNRYFFLSPSLILIFYIYRCGVVLRQCVRIFSQRFVRQQGGGRSSFKRKTGKTFRVDFYLRLYVGDGPWCLVVFRKLSSSVDCCVLLKTTPGDA